jgi:hypothetical protein
VIDETMSTSDLLEAWREATRAAELSERLARVALEAADLADQNAMASEEISRMAERAAEAAQNASETARAAAQRASLLATSARDHKLRDADVDAADARAAATRAGELYHKAELEARTRHGDAGSTD